uniref:Abortive infection protein n=1 Tax=Thermosporothrix sp. COM3 TaxID=2490863 RepID=A0A455SZ82_9CHLR|nr:abortive infection protein [Thermosporothrix sp. COM3]
MPRVTENRLFRLLHLARRPTPWWLALILIILAIPLVQILGALLAGFVLYGLGVRSIGGIQRLTVPGSLFSLIASLFTFGLPLFLLWIWVRWYEKRPFWALGFEWRRGVWRKLLFGLLIGLVAALISGYAAYALGLVRVLGGLSQPFSAALLLAFLVQLLSYVIQSSAEEIEIRGWLFPLLGRHFGVLTGLLLQALVFLFIHSLNEALSPLYLLFTLVFGVFAGLYVLYEGSLWGICALHTMYNFVQFILFLEWMRLRPIADPNILDIVTIPVWLIGIVILGFLLSRRRRTLRGG